MKNAPLAIIVAVIVMVLAWYWLVPSALPPVDPALLEPVLRKLASGQRTVIVYLGDSITAGTAAPFPFSRRVDEALREHEPRCSLETLNAGVPGDTAERGLARVGPDVISRNPDLVFVEFGWNDYKNGISAEKFEAAMSKLVGQLRRETRATVCILTTTHVDVTLANWSSRSRNRILRRIAEEQGCGLIDLYAAFSHARGNGTSLPDLISADHLHPSEKGQSLIAGEILRHFGIEQPPG